MGKTVSTFKNQFPKKVEEFRQANNKLATLQLLLVARDLKMLNKMTKLNLCSAMKVAFPHLLSDATPDIFTKPGWIRVVEDSLDEELLEHEKVVTSHKDWQKEEKKKEKKKKQEEQKMSSKPSV